MSDPSSDGQNVFDSPGAGGEWNFTIWPGRTAPLGQCGFITNVWAELQLAGPKHRQAQTAVLNAARYNRPVIPVFGAHMCVQKEKKTLTIACSLLSVPSVCLPISKPTEQVLPQRAAKTQKTANKRWHSFSSSSHHSHACAQWNVKLQLWSGNVLLKQWLF